MDNIFTPVQKVFRVVFQKPPVLFWHMSRHVGRIRGKRLTYMSRNTDVMVKNFNTVSGSTDVYFLTNKFIGDRILAIPDSYEIIGLYGGS